jgi:hypothetical protein
MRCRSTLAAIEREEWGVAWFRRRRGPDRASGRPADPEDLEYLAGFVQSRRGVEAFIEPRTTVTETTVLLVAHDGEWTRRRVPSVAWAHAFCNRHQVPSYDAAVVGIPQRMRDHIRRQKMAEKRERRPQ